MRRSFFVGTVVLSAVGLAAACSGGSIDDSMIPGQADDAGGGMLVPGPDGALVSVPSVADLGKECAEGAQCLSLVCAENKCQQPTAADGVKNQSETDIDCGGPTAPSCAPTKSCAVPSDCTSSVCTGAICQAPSFTDGVKNGSESDTDCGGADAPFANRCATARACAQHNDCQSDGCGDDGKCGLGRSCTQLHGGRTCGAGEFGDGAARHESCCAEAYVPTRNVYLDKYLVTAGRMRSFIERVGGDVRSAVSRSPKWVGAWTQYLPTNMTEALEQLGPNAQDWEWPAPGTPSFPRNPWAARGCQVNNGGSRTYFQVRGDDEHKYPKDTLDEKTLNCVTASMMLAFCIWDGKDLLDPDDYKAAWVGNDNRNYPWGAAPAPSTTDYAQFDYAAVRFSYQFPAYIAPDATVHISAPGRKFLGNGPFGHSDLAGNVIEQTRRGSVVYYLSSGSWERHIVSMKGNTYTDANSVFNRRYYAIGGRCGRR